MEEKSIQELQTMRVELEQRLLALVREYGQAIILLERSERSLQQLNAPPTNGNGKTHTNDKRDARGKFARKQ
jgi:hypothetical protein